MGVTHYVTMTTREYVLLARLEGQVRALLATATVYGDNSQAARGVLKTTIDQLDTSRNGGKPK